MPIFAHSISLISFSLSKPELFKTFMGLFGVNKQEAKKNLSALSADDIIKHLIEGTANTTEIWRAFLKPEYQASIDPANDFLNDPASRQCFIGYGENGRDYLRAVLLTGDNLTSLNTGDAQARRLYVNHSEVMQQWYDDRTTIDYVIEEYYRWSASLSPRIKDVLNDSQYEALLGRCLSSGVLPWSALVSIDRSYLQRLLVDFSTLDPVFLDQREEGAAAVQISAAALGDLDVNSRVQILQGGAVTRLLQKGDLVISDLVALEVDLRRALFVQNSLILYWLEAKKLTMADVLALDPQWRTLLFNDPNLLSARFDFKQAVSLDALNDFFKSYCVDLLPTLKSLSFERAMPMYLAMLRHPQEKDLLIERQVVFALEKGLETHALSDTEQFSIHHVLWQWYAAQCVSPEPGTQYDFKDAFDHVTVAIEQSLKQGSWRTAESYCEQLALLCVRMKEPVHAAYYWCQAANLADKQGDKCEAAQRRYYQDYVRGLQLFNLSAEDQLCVLALTASLHHEFLGFDDDFYVSDQLYADVQVWLTCVILTPSRVDAAMSRYGADINHSFKDYLYGALMSLPSTELKWQGIWQTLLSGYVLHQLFLPEVPGAAMNQAFFMAELQKCVMDQAFTLEACDSTYITAGLKALPNLARKIQQEYPFLHNALLKANVVLGVTIGSSSKLLTTDSPPNFNRDCSISSMATPIQTYNSRLGSSAWMIPVTPSLFEAKDP